jgi:hypothetical protein
MRKPRKPETDDERSERHELAAHLKKLQAKAADDAVDAMIRRNISLYGA